MWRFSLVPLLAAVSVGASAPPAGTDVAPRPVPAARPGISVRVPRGWHLIHRSLTDVRDPAQRLAVASFEVRLASHACECGEPNVRAFPRAGAFLFMWEYAAPYPSARLKQIPRRPQEFRVTQESRHWFECAGPNWSTSFRDVGRVFQVEVYLGRAAGPRVRAKMDALLNSLRVAPLRSS